MKRSLVIGKTNVGKTLFCVHFAKFMGLKEIRWLIERSDGRTEQRRMSVGEAERTLSDPIAHRTRDLQSVRIEFARGKGDRELLLTDTTGLTDGVNPDLDLRQAMAKTLEALLSSSFVLHLVDAYEIGRSGQGLTNSGALLGPWNELDEQLARFGAQKQGYLVLANKMDLPGADDGFRRLKERLSGQTVLPISALHGTGFREVKQHVWKLV